jgi:hypothetical protein
VNGPLVFKNNGYFCGVYFTSHCILFKHSRQGWPSFVRILSSSRHLFGRNQAKIVMSIPFEKLFVHQTSFVPPSPDPSKSTRRTDSRSDKEFSCSCLVDTEAAVHARQPATVHSAQSQSPTPLQNVFHTTTLRAGLLLRATPFLNFRACALFSRVLPRCASRSAVSLF